MLLAAVSLSGQIRNRTRNSMKIPSTSNNLIRSKLCAQLMFSQDDKVERWKDVEVLDRFPFSGSHTTNVESETMERSSRGGGGRRFDFCFFLLLSAFLSTRLGRLPSEDVGGETCWEGEDCV